MVKPSTIQAARDCLRDVRTEMEPAPASQRIAILTSLADQLAMPDALRSGDRARIATFWAAYHDDLSHLPAEVLARACASYRQSGERWYPTSGQLREIARRDERWRDDAACMAGLRKLAVAKPDGPRSYVGSEDVERELSAKLATALKRIGAAEKANAESEAQPCDPSRWDDAGRKADP